MELHDSETRPVSSAVSRFTTILYLHGRALGCLDHHLDVSNVRAIYLQDNSMAFSHDSASINVDLVSIPNFVGCANLKSLYVGFLFLNSLQISPA
jgi:hypothetical protein